MCPGGFLILPPKRLIEGVINFKDRKVFEVFPHAVNREGLFDERLFAYGVGSPGDAACVAFLGVNLSNPSGIPVAGRSKKDIGM